MTNKNVSLSDKQQMIDWIAKGAGPADTWRIGTEHEKFLFYRDDLRPVIYGGPNGIRVMLNNLLARLGENARPVMEHGNIIGIRDGMGGSVTLEPGGQLELSGAPLKNLHQTCAETGRHLTHMRAVCDALGIGMLSLGFNPKWGRDDIDWMPKGRYKIMREYMPKVGAFGLDMMLRSCTVQVNLDFADEEDMRRKFRTSLALQPVATALFANSPFKDGVPSGLVSTRAHVWTDTDNARCGVPDCVFDPTFGYEQWVDYVLDVPMYFLYRDDEYLDVAGKSFRDFMKGRLVGFEDEIPTMTDFEDHVTTVFPEVRLKQFIEMRGADGGSWGNICALPAFWVGLLYDDESLAAAETLAAPITANDVMAARLSVARDGLNGKLADYDVYDLATRLVDIARAGLHRRGVLDSGGNDETGFLTPLQNILRTRKTYADEMLLRYHREWNESVDQAFIEHIY